MNVDQPAATSQNPEPATGGDQTKTETQPAHITVAGTILTSTKDAYCVDVNGAIYEIAASDAIDVQIIPPLDAGKDTGGDDTAAGKDRAQVALFTVNADVVLVRRTPVPAVLVAALGTWMSVVPVPENP
jgi:hypothetical protein